MDSGEEALKIFMSALTCATSCEIAQHVQHVTKTQSPQICSWSGKMLCDELRFPGFRFEVWGSGLGVQSEELIRIRVIGFGSLSFPNCSTLIDLGC